MYYCEAIMFDHKLEGLWGVPGGDVTSHLKVDA
jgi:hypothetical protein